MSNKQTITISAVLLGLFAIVIALLVSFTNEVTIERIEQNYTDYKLEKLHELISSDAHDNPIESDTTTINDPEFDKSGPVTVYRARKASKPIAVVVQSVAPDGYSGRITLLVAIKYNGELIGVRVFKHTETPGLGDAIETRKSNWIRQFDGKSLNNPESDQWRVKRDGGKFDQITSATISSRAIVNIVHKTLRYYELHRDELFAIDNKLDDKQ